jgi:dienelactone hydrolase
MRTLEILLLAVATSYLLWLSFGTGTPNSVFEYLPFVAVALMVIHLLLEGYRWHMVPAYVLVVCTLISFPWCRAQEFKPRLTVVAVMWLFAAVLIAGSGILGGLLYPVFCFAPLGGKYRVGTAAKHLIDTRRVDPYAPNRESFREVMVQFWYPAESSTPKSYKARYRNGRKESWRSANLALVKSRSYRAPRLLSHAEKFPLLFFSGPNSRFQNTFQAEDLASHGYIVAAVEHPYGSDIVSFPDGRSILRRKENVFLHFSSEAALVDSNREVTGELSVRSADIQFVLDCIENPDTLANSDRTLSPQMDDAIAQVSQNFDRSKIGVFGHSFGGAVAAELCCLDPKFRAGVNMDGWMFGKSGDEGVRRPFFFMIDATPRPGSADVQDRDSEKRRLAARTLQGYHDVERSLDEHGGYFLQVPGLEHMNYSDYPLYSRVKAWTGAGAIDARRAHLMINRLTLAFFNTHLQNAPAPIPSSIAAEFPEADFRIVKPAKRENRFVVQGSGART